MAKDAPPFDVTCPCCNAVLKVDPAIKGVIAHTAAVKPKMFADMEEAARAMKEQDSRRDSIFRIDSDLKNGCATARRSADDLTLGAFLRKLVALLRARSSTG